MKQKGHLSSVCLGTLDDTTNAIRGTLEISEDDSERYLAAARAVDRLQKRFGFPLVERNFREYLNLKQYLAIVISLGREYAVPDRLRAGEVLMSQLWNWLASMRLFLDHSETSIKRRFGESSQELSSFKSAAASAYDGSPSYRFVYQLRNYFQHCGLPPAQLSLQRPAVAAAEGQLQEVRFQLRRDQLLAEFHSWGRAEADIRSLPEVFDYEDMLRQAMDRLREINRACLCIDIEAAAKAAANLDEALQRLHPRAPGTTPAVLKFSRPDTGSSLSISFSLINVSAVESLLQVARGVCSAESLIQPSPTFKSTLDPATVKEHLKLDRRGVQILTAWLESHGDNQEFVHFVNRAISEDRGIGPTIEGLSRISTILLSMTSGVLGTSPEGLLGQFLNAYAVGSAPDDAQ